MQKKPLILAVVALILIGGSVFVWQEKVSQTIKEPVGNQLVTADSVVETSTEIIARNTDVSKWKTYRDDKHRLEFKYPEEMFELFHQTEPVENAESMTTDVVSLFLFFRLPGNTSQTPTISFFFNQLSDNQDRRNEACEEVMVNAQKARLCSTKQDLENDLLTYHNYVQHGTCLERGNYSGSLYIDVNTRIVSKQKYTDGITIDLDCLHSESLGNVYKSIYQSVRFLESEGVEFSN